MQAELDSLDEKIAQLAKLCQKLRGENKRLSEKVNAARTRLETLLNQIPDGAE
jgi:cell division protein ZapB